MTDFEIRPIPAAEHAAYVAAQPTASFLQTPGWATVKSEWKAESLGWYDGERQVGAGLVLYRQMPKVRRYLAYLPEGPVIDWSADDVGRWLRPTGVVPEVAGRVRRPDGAAGGDQAVEARTIKDAIAAGQHPRLGDVPADATEPSGVAVAQHLRELGWKPPRAGEGFAAGQPQYVFQVPLEGKDDDAVLRA